MCCTPPSYLIGEEGGRCLNPHVKLCIIIHRASPAIKKQNAMRRKKPNPRQFPPVINETLNLGKNDLQRTPYRIYSTSTLPECQGETPEFLVQLAHPGQKTPGQLTTDAYHDKIFRKFNLRAWWNW